MAHPIIPHPSETDSALTHTSFLEAQLSFIGHSQKRKCTQTAMSLWNIRTLLWLPPPALLQRLPNKMQENDLGVEITAETWHEIWQNAKRICLSSSTEKYFRTDYTQLKTWKCISLCLCLQCKMTAGTYVHCMWSSHRNAHCCSNIVQDMECFWCQLWRESYRSCKYKIKLTFLDM